MSPPHEPYAVDAGSRCPDRGLSRPSRAHVGSVCGVGLAAAGDQVGLDLTETLSGSSEGGHRLWLVGSFPCSLVASMIIYLCIKKRKDGGFQPVCGGLPSGAGSELEPLEERE